MTAAAGSAAPISSETRDLQPIVLTGSQVLALSGAPIGEIWAYRYAGLQEVFVQVPIQVDELRPPCHLSGVLRQGIERREFAGFDACSATQ